MPWMLTGCREILLDEPPTSAFASTPTPTAAPAVTLVADIDPELGDVAAVVLGPVAVGEDAAHVVGGAEDEAPAAGFVARQGSDPDARRMVVSERLRAEGKAASHGGEHE